MSFLCQIWPKFLFFGAFWSIFRLQGWRLKFYSYTIVEDRVEWFRVNFELDLIWNAYDRSVKTKFSRVLYFRVTCFFVVLYLNHVSDYFFWTECLSYCTTLQVTSLRIFQALFCDFITLALVLSFSLRVSALFLCFNCCNRNFKRFYFPVVN